MLTFQVQIIEVSRCGFVLWEKKLPNGGGFQAKIPASDGSTINKQHIISAWGSSGPRFALETNPHAQCSLVVHRPHHFRFLRDTRFHFILFTYRRIKEGAYSANTTPPFLPPMNKSEVPGGFNNINNPLYPPLLFVSKCVPNLLQA